MSNNEIRSDLLPKLAFKGVITSDATTEGAIINIADFDEGFVYTLFASAYTDGTYTPVLYESDADDMAGATLVPDYKLQGALTALSADTAEGDNLVSFGAFSTKQYLRLDIVSTATTTGADVLAIFQGKSSIKPAIGLSA